MPANPEPDQSFFAVFRESSVLKADARGPEDANLLQVQGRMPGIVAKEFEVFVGESANVIRKLPVMEPKVRVGEVFQSGLQRPDSKSSSAFFAR